MVMGCESSRSSEAQCLSPTDAFGQTPNGLSNGLAKSTMTDFQMDCVRSTWPLFAKKKLQCGSDIFRSIFALHPNIKKMFSFRNKSDEDMMMDPDFLTHAQDYMDALGRVCDNLTLLNTTRTRQNHDFSDGIDKHIVLLGATHASLPLFNLQYIYTFFECTHSAWEQALGEEYTPEVREAWACVFDIIAARFACGFRLYNEDDQDMIASDVGCQEDSNDKSEN